MVKRTKLPTLIVTLMTCAIVLAATEALPLPPQDGQGASTPQAFTFDGDVALWTIAVKPEKTGDFEAIMAKLREGLAKSTNAQRRAQAAGWSVMKLAKPLPDGTVAYVHVINPVVHGADYSVMQVLYDEFPDEKQALYDKYRGAFAKSLSLAVGPRVIDMSATP